MDVLACIKRVPNTGARIVLTDDGQDVDAAGLGYTMSPHEECAVEAAVSVADAHDGSSTVLTLGPEDAAEQLRTGLAMTADEALLLESDGGEWRPRETAAAIADAVHGRSEGDLAYDLLLFGNESADAANYQVGLRVARELDVPFLAGVTDLDVEADRAVARREVTGGEEVYELDLPAAVSVTEGINEPRYASMRAKMRARNQEIDREEPNRAAVEGTYETVRLEVPETSEGRAEIVGEGPEAVPDVIELLRDELEVV